MRKTSMPSTKVLVFGNPIVGIDSMPLRIMGKLEKRFPMLEFKVFDPNDNLEEEGSELNIIDTVQGIKKAMLITDIGMLKASKLYSMHDFDLGHSLKIMKKLGYLKSVKIFGVPMKIREGDALNQLTALIKANLS